MKIGIAIVSLAFIATGYVLIASPAATHNWVVKYVSTNSVSSATVTNATIAASINATSTQKSFVEILREGGTNAVKTASTAAMNEMSPLVSSVLGNTVRGL